MLKPSETSSEEYDEIMNYIFDDASNETGFNIFTSSNFSIDPGDVEYEYEGFLNETDDTLYGYDENETNLITEADFSKEVDEGVTEQSGDYLKSS